MARFRWMWTSWRSATARRRPTIARPNSSSSMSGRSNSGSLVSFQNLFAIYFSHTLFSAHVSGSDVEYKGTIEIPNLSDENDASEVDVSFLLAHFVFPKLFHTKMFCFRSTCPWTWRALIRTRFAVSSTRKASSRFRYLIFRWVCQSLSLQDALAVYIRELKEEFSKGLILPTDKVKPQVDL